MFVQFENATIVKSQSFPNGIAALHHGVKRTAAGIVPTDETAIDVYDQVAVFFVKLLKHVLTADYADLADKQRKKLFDPFYPRHPRFNAVCVRKAARSIRGIAHKFRGDDPAQLPLALCMAGTMSIWRRRRTNVSPKSRRSRASRAATRASH